MNFQGSVLLCVLIAIGFFENRKEKPSLHNCKDGFVMMSSCLLQGYTLLNRASEIELKELR